MKNLQVLELSHNQISELPSDFNQLTNLTDLLLTGNRLTESSIQIKSLKCLFATDNLTQSTNLKFLYLSNNQLSEFSFVSKLSKLEILSSNQITTIPNDIDHLTKLKAIDLRNCPVRILPFSDMTQEEKMWYSGFTPLPGGNKKLIWLLNFL